MSLRNKLLTVGATGLIALSAGCETTDNPSQANNEAFLLTLGGALIGARAAQVGDGPAMILGNAMQDYGIAQAGRSQVNVYNQVPAQQQVQQKRGFVTLNDLVSEHNVYEDGEKGMRVYVRMDAKNLQNETLVPQALLVYPGGRPVFNNGNQVIFYSKINAKPAYENTIFKDNSIYIWAPYSRMNVAEAQGNKTSLELKVFVSKKSDGTVVGGGKSVKFTLISERDK